MTTRSTRRSSSKRASAEGPVRFVRTWQRYRPGDRLEPLGSLREWLFENGYVKEVQMKRGTA